MKPDKIRNMSTEELRGEVAEIEEQLFRLRFQMSMGQTDGLKKMRNMRKDLARIHTIVRERELAQAGGK